MTQKVEPMVETSSELPFRLSFSDTQSISCTSISSQMLIGSQSSKSAGSLTEESRITDMSRPAQPMDDVSDDVRSTGDSLSPPRKISDASRTGSAWRESDAVEPDFVTPPGREIPPVRVCPDAPQRPPPRNIACASNHLSGLARSLDFS